MAEPQRASAPLDPQQQAAVERSGQNVCVIAGPGSGKTRVLVTRFSHLVHKGISPLRILAITFTEKAATEIKQRLVFEFAHLPGLRSQMERAYVSTLHGFCARLLRENAVAAGVDPDFRVLDERQQRLETARSAEAALDELLAERKDEFRSLLRGLSAIDLVDSLVDAHEARRVSGEPADLQLPLFTAKEGELEFDRFLELVGEVFRAEPRGWSARQRAALEPLASWSRRIGQLRGQATSLEHFRLLNEFACKLTDLKRNNEIYEGVREIRDTLIPSARRGLIGDYYRVERAMLEEAITRLDQVYYARKRALSALDYSDLEEFAIGLLREDDAIRNAVQTAFDAVLMDELQDTNALQWELLDLVRRPKRFFAVGDINQSIYGFRYAEPDLFRRYREGLQSADRVVDRLSRNYRSRPEILAAIEAITSGLPGIEPNELRAARPSLENAEPCVEVLIAEAGERDMAEELEARLVAARIREWAASLPLEFGNFGVLVRNMEAIPRFEQAFREAGTPYLVSRGRYFFESQEVIDLTRLLRVVANPRDEISFAAILRSPFAGLSDESLFLLHAGGVLEDEQSERLQRFRSMLARLRELADFVAPDRLLAAALDDCGYESGLDAHARANVEKFLGQVREWWAAQRRPLAVLVEELDALRNAESEPDAPPGDSSDAVQIMSVHAAKGLEFPVVFLAAMHKGINRFQPQVCHLSGAGLGARWRDPAGGRSIADPVHEAFSVKVRRRELEEGNRLLYVAMTRAQDRLVMSFAAAGKPSSPWPDIVMRGVNAAGARVTRIHAAPPSEAVSAVRNPESPPMILEPAVPAAQNDSTVSVTSIATYADCPRRYYLSRYLGLETPVHPDDPESAGEISDQPATDFGREVHALLAGSVSTAAPEAVALAANFQTSELAGRLARATRVEREFDFLFAIDEVVLRGQIDLWFEEAGELVVVDYKTDRIAPDDLDRLQAYAVQLRFYAMALERLTGRRPDRAYLYLLRAGGAVECALGPDEIRGALDVLTRLKQAQHRLDFPPRTSGRCDGCPGPPLCIRVEE
jgi:ATP-dependent exoDNAse (exonuclease V) beta subunit